MSQENNKPKNSTQSGPFGGGMMPVAKAKDFKGSIAKLIGYLGKHKWMILLVCILAIASTVFTIVGPKILGQATDELFTGVMNQILASL